MITPVYSPTATERVLPRLALDFTTGVLDPRVTVTRALNTATRVNSSGLIETINADLPRFDYDPITLAAKGLLVEEQRTNLLTYSAAFDDAAWAKLSSDAATKVASPSGTSDANLMYPTSSASFVGVRQFLVAGSFASGIYTISFYAKSAGKTAVGVVDFTATIGFGAAFDLSTGVATNGVAGYTSTMTNVGNGWYRCTMSSTSSYSNAANLAIWICVIDAVGGNSVTANGTNGIYLWGAQIEAGAFATSYIPTTATSVVRNADVVTMTGTNFSSWWVATTGAAVSRTLQNTVSGVCPSVQFDDAAASNFIVLRGNTTNPELYIKATTDQAQIDVGTIAANTAYVLSGAWDTNNCAATINGETPVPDTSVTIPTVTQARLGSDGTNYLNGCLQKFAYYPQRLLDAELQAFTK